VHDSLSEVREKFGVGTAVQALDGLASAKAPPAPHSDYAITIYGKNEMGLLAKVSSIFADLGVNIIDMEGRLLTEDEPMYVLHFQVEMPQGTATAVKSALRDRAVSLNIEIASMDPVAAGVVASVAQIRDVRLETTFFRLDGRVEDSELPLYRTRYSAEVSAGDHTRLGVKVRLQLVYEGHGVEDSTSRALEVQPLKASATFQVEYAVPRQKFAVEQLQAFAEINAVFNVFPYWRQLVQSMLPSMGVHKLVLPVFRFPLMSMTRRTAQSAAEAQSLLDSGDAAD